MLNEMSHIFEQSGLINAKQEMIDLRLATMRKSEKHKSRPFSDYYSNISKKTIATLKHIYKYDIKLFGYPDSPFEV